MVTLPPSPRRAMLTSFWLVVTPAAGVLLWMMLRPVDALAALATAVATVTTMAVIPWARPGLVERFYEYWNRAASIYARGTRLLVQAVCYLVVFALIGRAGSRLPLREPVRDASGWRLHPQPPTVAYFSSHTGRSDADLRGAWPGRLVRWAWQTGQLWAVVVIPFFLVLDALDAKRDYEPTPDIYTLY